ncbi:uncharacterized protein J7T54_006321 [Emericellopsis cladophorae]|uniref:Glycosyltransferase family 31 protein n=1 Tax=Emericellopsis cladophorae TaxID=2686198 RepID=A0A9P9Y9G9_9HYPO|nr:uncharacterized protein J7T54_006321 [Emericellopsis cladophorae]KAI6785982.1 hypothetical protein J7T54_006321 [Emericellopsis cladophorae]
MKAASMSLRGRLERLYSRVASHVESQPFGIDVSDGLAPVVQRACSRIPHPVVRVFKLLLLVLVLFIAFLNLPSLRPYTTDLVLNTKDLRQPILNTASPDDHKATQPASSSNHVMDCGADIDRLAKLRDRFKLDDEVEYLKRYVRITREPIERQQRTFLQQRFLPEDDEGQGLQVLDLTKNVQHEQTCPEPLEIAVTQSPSPTEADLSDFIFAISTDVKRMRDPLIVDEWAFWLTNGLGHSNGGKLFLRLIDASDSELTDAAQRLAEAGIDAQVSALDSRLHREMAVRYLDLVPMLYFHPDSVNRKWLVLCDDDTFFTSAHSLVERFKQYDHEKLFYVGSLSEDAIAVKTHGSQAFGGAGVFISRPLAQVLSTVHQTCKTRAKIRQSNTGWGPQGDILLRNCIYDNTDIRLSQLHGLWQLDIRGDASGFYESGLSAYSIHHFKGGTKWHTTYPLNTTKIAYTCGEDCPYQRFITEDDFIIANGYSVAQYPYGVEFNLDQVERTFRPLMVEKEWNFDYMYGPQRPSLSGTGKKISWELGEAETNLEDGVTIQTYIRRKDDVRWTTEDGKPMKSVDGIIELVWISA